MEKESNYQKEVSSEVVNRADIAIENIDSMLNDVEDRFNGKNDVSGVAATYKQELDHIRHFVKESLCIIAELNAHIEKIVTWYNDSNERAERHFQWYNDEYQRSTKLTNKLKAVRDILNLFTEEEK